MVGSVRPACIINVLAFENKRLHSYLSCRLLWEMESSRMVVMLAVFF